MRFAMRIVFLALAAPGTATPGIERAAAQIYPAKPIRLINPFSPGGSLEWA